MNLFALHIESNDWLLWVNIALNALEMIVLLVVIWVLLHWVKRMVDFMDLMSLYGEEESKMKSRLEEWDNLMGDKD